MLFKHLKIKSFICCVFLNSVATSNIQTIPVKSNMGQADEIFVKRALMEDLSPSATESNMYFLPIRKTLNGQYQGEVYVGNSTGFSITEAKKNTRFSSMKLTSPTGQQFSINGNIITCVNNPCVLGSVNVTINPSSGGSNPEIRTVSINQDNNITGRWQVNLSGLTANTTNKDFVVTHEGGTLLALHDSDQVSQAGTANKFIFELRRQLQLVPLAADTKSQDPYAKISGNDIQSLNAVVTVTPQSPTPLPLAAVPVGGYQVDISPDGEISTTIPGLPVGNYSLEVDFTAFLTSGEVLQRTAYYGFPVINTPFTLVEKSTTKVVDNNRMEVSLDVERKNSFDQDIIAFYAEIWSDDKPVSFINTMTHINELSQISVNIDTRWFALAQSSNRQNFTFKNIKLLDPDTFLLIDEMDSLTVPVTRFPDAVNLRASEITIDDSMINGKNDVYIPIKQAEQASQNIRGAFNNGIFLVHGWCDNAAAWNQGFFNDGPTVEYTNTNSSISRNNFAMAIRDQADAVFTDWFSVVAHSQGGQAAVHLQAYFFSGLDLSPAPRPIQTVGTPYQGSTLMDLYFFSGAGIINAIFNFSDCEPQFSLTTPGSFFWSIFLPTASQSDTFYYRTIHDTPNNFWQSLQFWRWKCNAASYILGGNDDGVTRPFKSWLLFGNNMGITEGQCHTGGMMYDDQRDDVGRNNIMDQMGRVTATWTAWLDRDGPSGSGDWEQRSLHAGVCAAPINYEARRVGTGTPANLTGEVFFLNSPAGGLVCRNADQADNTCFDYEVRFLCP